MLTTAFTNYIFNVNVSTALHCDDNNTKGEILTQEDLVIMTVFKNNQKQANSDFIEGTFYPEFSVGFDLHTKDIVMMNGQYLHCNNHYFPEPEGLEHEEVWNKPYRANLILYRYAGFEHSKMIAEKFQNIEENINSIIWTNFVRRCVLQSPDSKPTNKRARTKNLDEALPSCRQKN